MNTIGRTAKIGDMGKIHSPGRNRNSGSTARRNGVRCDAGHHESVTVGFRPRDRRASWEYRHHPPPRFSTTNRPLKASESVVPPQCVPAYRQVPPAANGAMIFTGRDGHSCAARFRAHRKTKPASAAQELQISHRRIPPRGVLLEPTLGEDDRHAKCPAARCHRHRRSCRDRTGSRVESRARSGRSTPCAGRLSLAIRPCCRSTHAPAA